MDGPWEAINATLRERVRVAGAHHGFKRRDPGQPAGQDLVQRGPRGDDAGKQGGGRKRHLLVNTEGVLLSAWIYPDDESDASGVA